MRIAGAMSIGLLLFSSSVSAVEYPIFIDGFESGGLCSWPSESASCGVGSNWTLTIPGSSVTMTFAYVPGGTFLMGSPSDERGRFDQEDLHEVTLTTGFWIGQSEVTQAQWEAVMATTPWVGGSCPPTFGDGAAFPAYCLSWDMIAGPGGYVDGITSLFEVFQFRLPTEAEWERAARAGTQTEFSFVTSSDWDLTCGSFPEADDHMWWCGNSGGLSHPVGSKNPNRFGLVDMHGNVWEWVQDYYGSNLGTSPQLDPTGPPTGVFRVVRSCAWFIDARECRSASRGGIYPYEEGTGYGFRLVVSQE